MARKANRKKGLVLGADNGPRVRPGERSTPAPSIVDGREWQVQESPDVGTAWIQRTGTDGPGRMLVPRGELPAERRIRLHEMAHVRWTPNVNPADLPEGVSWSTFNAVEDCRVHRRLSEIGYDDQLRAPLPMDWSTYTDQFDRDIETMHEGGKPHWTPLEVARMTVACDGMPEGNRWRDITETYGYGPVVEMVDDILRREMGGRRPAFKKTIATAVAIEEAFRDMVPVSPVKMRVARDYREDDGYGSWGYMSIFEMPLSVPLPRRLKSRRNRATDTGAIPRHWHRMPIDSRVFNRRSSRPAGGTVLLDQSGSMGLDISEVIELMGMFPAVTIATYAGSGDTGSLRIIARNGKRATDEDCYHPNGGNIVDGPALEWLATQAAPRIWISDGYVTGAGECQHRGLHDEVDDTCERARIQRVDNLSQLLGGVA